jgi:acyl-CoA synthetase (NDP forming)
MNMQSVAIPSIAGIGSTLGTHINAALDFMQTPQLPDMMMQTRPQAEALASAYRFVPPRYQDGISAISVFQGYRGFFGGQMAVRLTPRLDTVVNGGELGDKLAFFQEQQLGAVNWHDAARAGLVTFDVASSVMDFVQRGSRLMYSIPGAMYLLGLNGVYFPGKHVTAVDQLKGFGEGQYIVKAAVPTKKKMAKGMVRKTDRASLEATFTEVLDAMRRHGEDVSLGVIVQSVEKPGTEVLVSVKNTPYGIETTVKLGGELAEERTTAVKTLGQVDEATLLQRLSTIPGIPSESIPNLVQVVMGFQRTAESNHAIDLIETNPVICRGEDGSAVPVDVRLFTREIEPSVTDIMPQDRFNEQMDRMLNPKIALYIAPNGSLGEGGKGKERYMMTLNALASEREGRQIVFLHPQKESIKITLPDGTVVERKCYKTIEAIVDEVGTPDVAVVPLKPEATVETAKICSRFEIPMVMIGSGYGELGERGRVLKEELLTVFREGRIIGVGPNTVGNLDARHGLDTSFLFYDGLDKSRRPLGAGRIALMTQSGGKLAMYYDAVQEAGLRISHGVAFGNGYATRPHQMLMYNDTRDLTAEVYYLESDPGRAFIDALKNRTQRRGVVIVKGGRHSANSAIRSHTDSISGSNSTFIRAAEEAGAIVVTEEQALPLIISMIDSGMAVRLADKIRAARERGDSEPGVQILAQSGGDGVTANDSVLDVEGLSLATPSHDRLGVIQDSIGGIIKVNPNPIDIGPMGSISTIMGALAGDPSIGLYLLSYNKFFDERLIPLNDDGSGNPLYFNTVLVMTNDPHGSMHAAAREKGWKVSTRNERLAVYSIAKIYEYARFLADSFR